jgi:hypothetical protein
MKLIEEIFKISLFHVFGYTYKYMYYKNTYNIKATVSVLAMTHVIYNKIKRRASNFCDTFSVTEFCVLQNMIISIRKSVMSRNVYHIEWKVTMSWYISLLKSQPSVPTQNNIYRQGKYVKQTLYRPGQALRIPGVWGFQISRHWHMKVVRFSVLRTGRLYPQ